jgi:hypothetical protein
MGVCAHTPALTAKANKLCKKLLSICLSCFIGMLASLPRIVTTEVDLLAQVRFENPWDDSPHLELNGHFPTRSTRTVPVMVPMT